MTKGLSIHINENGLSPLRDPESPIKPPPSNLPDLEEELRDHLARRPSNSDLPALAEWNREKERLQFWIDLSRASVVAPVFERKETSMAEALEAIEPFLSFPLQLTEIPMPKPKKKSGWTDEAKAKAAATRAATKAAKLKAMAPREVQKEKLEGARPRKAQAPPPQQMDVDENSWKGQPSFQAMTSLAAGILEVLSDVVTMSPADRAQLLLPAANLDALAHQLATFLATGRIEVAA